MDNSEQNISMSIRKRRNISKNRSQNARLREKTPEPGRTPAPHEDTTSDDEENNPQRNSREIEADNTYEEMRRLVEKKANEIDPVYDINTDEILEARAMAANERRRRSISPFAVPDKDEICNLQRKGSFIDPSNKLLSTNYSLNLKDEDNPRRSSLTIDTSDMMKIQSSSLSPPLSASASPKDKNFPYPCPSTPKKLEEIVYPDEVHKQATEKSNLPKEGKKKELTKETDEKICKKAKTTKGPEALAQKTGELITRVIQVERTPSKKLSQEQNPVVQIRERVVRTPSRKLANELKPVVVRQTQDKQQETQPKTPPVKPARSKSASRLSVSFYVKITIVVVVIVAIILYFIYVKQ
ncbi:uncharacterized protein LOC126979325 [Leptidea sinapis]|uniref:uncharacterized protein LOC126979325 n=1 Tax=Leptidea sinapis TaxID=189913 RepID=UPI0021C2F7CC|nr:uncharacterized protein LOC126979325 [Leptidea sinapis]